MPRFRERLLYAEQQRLVVYGLARVGSDKSQGARSRVVRRAARNLFLAL